MPRPRRWWWVVGALVVAAVAASWLMRPDTYTATPKTTPLPSVRLDLAEQALADWITDLRAHDANVAALRITDLSATLVAQSGPMHADGAWAVTATLTWRYGGVDPSPARAEVTIDLQSVDSTVTVTGVGGPGRAPLWLDGPLTVSRTATTLVATAAGVDHASYARWASRAVTVVDRVVTGWDGPLVVEVPATAAQLDRTLGAAPGTYANVAAVTASVDGSDRADAPVHVFVNPEVMGRLVGSSAQIVLSHEATHAATDAVLNTHRPIWLTEGFADYVALRDVQVPLSESAGQITALVRKDGPPTHLPDQSDFDATSDSFGAEYESAWLANVQLADDGGQSGLVRLYGDVGKGMALEQAMRSDIGYGVAELTRRWRRRLSDLAGQAGS